MRLHSNLIGSSPSVAASRRRRRAFYPSGPALELRRPGPARGCENLPRELLAVYMKPVPASRPPPAGVSSRRRRRARALSGGLSICVHARKHVSTRGVKEDHGDGGTARESVDGRESAPRLRRYEKGKPPYRRPLDAHGGGARCHPAARTRTSSHRGPNVLPPAGMLRIRTPWRRPAGAARRAAAPAAPPRRRGDVRWPAHARPPSHRSTPQVPGKDNKIWLRRRRRAPTSDVVHGHPHVRVASHCHFRRRRLRGAGGTLAPLLPRRPRRRRPAHSAATASAVTLFGPMPPQHALTGPYFT